MGVENKEKIGLYFGSFNPIHVGHLILAEYIVQHCCLDKIWFVVTPHNPLKNNSQLADDNIRLQLTELATQDNPHFEVSDAEFLLDKPSYTINTLRYLTEKHLDKDFSIIMGEDNLRIFDRWKDYEEILSHYNIYVYPRTEDCGSLYGQDYDEKRLLPLLKRNTVHVIDAPVINISSSYIRNQLKQGFSVQYMVTQRVYEEIKKLKLYM